jgi:hypothetical protein
MFCNTDNDAPYFRQLALHQIRERTFPYCEYAKSDIESAFPCMHMADDDLPYLMFARDHPDDTEFAGSDQDFLYVHTHGNFGPRPASTMDVYTANAGCEYLWGIKAA